LLKIDATPEITGSLEDVNSSPKRISFSISESSPILA